MAEQQQKQKIVKKKVWNDKQLAVMRWQCLPPTLQEHQSLTELGQALGIPRSTMYLWMDDPQWVQAKQAMARQVMLDLSPDFLSSLARDLLTPGMDKSHMVYWRYIYPQLVQEKNEGYLDEIAHDANAADSLDKLQARRVLAVQKFESLSTDQRQLMLSVLEDMEVIASDASSQGLDETIERPSYNVQKREQTLPPIRPKKGNQHTNPRKRNLSLLMSSATDESEGDEGQSAVEQMSDE